MKPETRIIRGAKVATVEDRGGYIGISFTRPHFRQIFLAIFAATETTRAIRAGDVLEIEKRAGDIDRLVSRNKGDEQTTFKF